jgi:hypothetical protein
VLLQDTKRFCTGKNDWAGGKPATDYLGVNMLMHPIVSQKTPIPPLLGSILILLSHFFLILYVADSSFSLSFVFVMCLLCSYNGAVVLLIMLPGLYLRNCTS